jgi:hypothetical protein
VSTRAGHWTMSGVRSVQSNLHNHSLILVLVKRVSQKAVNTKPSLPLTGMSGFIQASGKRCEFITERGHLEKFL